MRRSLVVFVLASMATIAVLALVSVGLSHAQAMRENATFMGSAGHHMSHDNHMDCDENTPFHMNVTQHAHGNICGTCEKAHDPMNMTEHMNGMH